MEGSALPFDHFRIRLLSQVPVRHELQLKRCDMSNQASGYEECLGLLGSPLPLSNAIYNVRSLSCVYTCLLSRNKQEADGKLTRYAKAPRDEPVSV